MGTITKIKYKEKKIIQRKKQNTQLNKVSRKQIRNNKSFNKNNIQKHQYGNCMLSKQGHRQNSEQRGGQSMQQRSCMLSKQGHRHNSEQRGGQSMQQRSCMLS